MEACLINKTDRGPWVCAWCGAVNGSCDEPAARLAVRFDEAGPQLAPAGYLTTCVACEVGTRMQSAAEHCVGTPYHHRGRRPGLGLDCVGLVLHAAACAGVVLPDRRAYPRRGDAELLRRWLHENFIPAERERPGDVLAFRIGRAGNVVHLAVRSERGMVHVHQGVGQVVDHRLCERWQRRLQGAWRVRTEHDGVPQQPPLRPACLFEEVLA